MIHLYAIAEGVEAVPAVSGIGGATVRRVAVEEVEAVVSEHGSAEPDATEEAVLAHARVVESLAAASGALLPARFGRAFPDERALEAALRDQLEALRRALTRVRGRVELGLRVLGDADEPPSEAPSGRAYMQAKLEATARAERLARELHEPLAATAAASTHSLATAPRLVLSGAYLVPAGEVEPFRARVAALEAAHPELTFVCTGPWPPYSFATAGEA
jgi:hypothetical protein